ncbi:DNA polymerase III subunit tau [bacterium BMS3Bbin09]|nr:DNA polymerase III subunit tau [bacterium BMS3Bbin09]HDH34199.1 DNA polymerase III subunit delta' [Nitrospirota bacterium]
MALKDIIGQEKALNILKGCINKERIPHAIFFAGDEGIGKKLTAINFAKTLNCTGTSDGPDLFADVPAEQDTAVFKDACGKCSSCIKIDKGSHPDIFFLGPEGDGGQITVSAIRQLEESLSYKPFEGEWKIAIIDNADRLNRSAANAFLQTLEEPSQKSILILISSRPDMLLTTIRSRCQRINFTPLPIDTMSRLLQEKHAEFDHEHASLLSTLSGGRLGYALNENLVTQRDWSFDIFNQMLGAPEDNIWEDRNAMEEWFEWGQLLLRDIAVYKTTGRADLLINRDKKDEIKKMSDVSELKGILKLSREFYTIKERLHFNLNKQLTFNYTSLLLKEMLGKKDH